MSKFVGDYEEAKALLKAMAMGTPDEDDTLESHEHGLTDTDDTLESHEHGLTDTDLDNLHQHLRELKGEV